MTELQNNDLVSKLWAASPVEPAQSNQINFSDNDEMVTNNQDSLSIDPIMSDAIPQDSIWTSNPLNTEDGIKDVDIPTVEDPIPTISQDNYATSTNPIETANEFKMEDSVANNTITNQSVDNWAIAENSINNIVNPDSQKAPSIVKRNPRVEYWKWLASGVLVSIWLLIIGAILFDNWSLLASAANSIKLTNDDTTNEIVKMENALAFGDSVSNTYIDDIISDSDGLKTEDSESEVEVLDDESIDSNEISSESDDEDDELNAKNSDDSQNETVETDEESDEENIVSDLEDEENISLNTDEKPTKSKMAWSIVSIFDEKEESWDSSEIEAEDSLDKVSPISYKHVDNVEDANWVMSANCDNLHCGNISEASLDELVLCTEFRQSDKLDDNANRIGSNWICRYKDVSELVQIEL